MKDEEIAAALPLSEREMLKRSERIDVPGATMRRLRNPKANPDQKSLEDKGLCVRVGLGTVMVTDRGLAVLRALYDMPDPPSPPPGAPDAAAFRKVGFSGAAAWFPLTPNGQDIVAMHNGVTRDRMPATFGYAPNPHMWTWMETLGAHHAAGRRVRDDDGRWWIMSRLEDAYGPIEIPPLV